MQVLTIPFATEPIRECFAGRHGTQRGLASYYKDFGTGENRWGDYSATVVDPLNESDMWTIQEYAGANNMWQTWWGIGESVERRRTLSHSGVDTVQHRHRPRQPLSRTPTVSAHAQTPKPADQSTPTPAPSGSAIRAVR